MGLVNNTMFSPFLHVNELLILWVKLGNKQNRTDAIAFAICITIDIGHAGCQELCQWLYFHLLWKYKYSISLSVDQQNETDAVELEGIKANLTSFPQSEEGNFHVLSAAARNVFSENIISLAPISQLTMSTETLSKTTAYKSFLLILSHYSYISSQDQVFGQPTNHSQPIKNTTVLTFFIQLEQLSLSQ